MFVTGLNTGPADLIHSASDICFLLPVSFTTGPVASRYPREDLHLLDDINCFHRVNPLEFLQLRA